MHKDCYGCTFASSSLSFSLASGAFHANRVPAKRSAGATHRFQPFQPSSGLFGKVDQPKQKRFFPNKTNKKKPTQPTKKGWSQKNTTIEILKTCLLCRGSLRYCFWEGQLGEVVWLSIDCYYHNHIYFLLLKDVSTLRFLNALIKTLLLLLLFLDKVLRGVIMYSE